MTLKKLLRSVALLLLPIALYYGVFLGFVGRVGLSKAIPGATAVQALWQYRDNPTPSVILGDSRLAHFNMAQVEQAAGRPFTNLAFGGASFKETLDMMEWLLDEYPELEEIVFGFTFYTFNQNYKQDRFTAIKNALYNPTALLTNLSFNLEMLQNLKLYLSSGCSDAVLGGGELETEDPAEYAWAEYTDPNTGQTRLLRTRVIDYLGSIAPYTRNWAPNAEAFERFIALLNRAEAQGVKVAVVLPPVHPALLEFEVEGTGIAAQMAPYLERLETETNAQVLDYELQNPPNFAEDQYFDGLHLDYKRGLPAWTEMLFTALN